MFAETKRCAETEPFVDGSRDVAAQSQRAEHVEVDCLCERNRELNVRPLLVIAVVHLRHNRRHGQTQKTRKEPNEENPISWSHSCPYVAPVR